LLRYLLSLSRYASEAVSVNLGLPHISETIRAGNLKFYTHLDGSSALFEVSVSALPWYFTVVVLAQCNMFELSLRLVTKTTQ